ncbi:acyltransferase [Candidatus Pseudothioglobus singularis]|nr:acyltransferase [Candidatus Pseudothioglobus singularis]
MIHSNFSKSTYRAEIDGLRAFAVLSVLAFHAFPVWLKGGFIGVDIFFVISGFLITSHIFEKLNDGSFSFSDFFGRRIRRIFPALTLVMTVSLFFGWFELLTVDYAQLGKHVASGAAFILNFILVNESGYFDNAAETKPMLHLWSLAVEEQFYIIWPLVLWASWKCNFNLLIVTIVIALSSFSLNLYYLDSKPIEMFFWSVGRFWELLTGSILAWLLLYKKEELLKIKLWIDKKLVRVFAKNVIADGSITDNIMAFLGLLLLTFGVIWINEDLAFPSKWTLIPISGALLVILAGSKAWLNRFILMNPLAVWMGLISYPLYLWHWPILSFMQIIGGEFPDRNARILAIIISILLAWLTYKFIERPIRYGGNLRMKTILLLLLSIAIGFAGLKVYDNNGVVSRYALFSDSDIDIERLTKISEAWQFSAYPKPSYGFKDPLTGLFRIGTNEASKTLFVGDSHKEQYFNSFEFLQTAKNGAYNSVMFSKFKTFPPNIKSFPKDPSIDVVALSYFWGMWYGSLNVKQELRCCGNGKNRTLGRILVPYKSSVEMDLIDSQITDYISALKSLGKRVIIILDSPFGEELNAQSMIVRDGLRISVKPNIVLTRKEAETRSADTRERLISIANKLNVEVIDPIAHLCASGQCNAFSTSNDLLYKDYDHLSLYASRNSVKYIKKIVEYK